MDYPINTTCQVLSSWGTFTVCSRTGLILDRDIPPIFGCDEQVEADTEHYSHMRSEVVRFDVEEWHKTNPTHNICEGVDILDLGYFYRTDDSGEEHYATPDFYWRREFPWVTP